MGGAGFWIGGGLECGHGAVAGFNRQRASAAAGIDRSAMAVGWRDSIQLSGPTRPDQPGAHEQQSCELDRASELLRHERADRVSRHERCFTRAAVLSDSSPVIPFEAAPKVHELRIHLAMVSSISFRTSESFRPVRAGT